MVRTTNQCLLRFLLLPAMLTFLFSFLVTTAQAQEKKIQGTVKDAKGSPVPSVTVAVKGTTVSTVTAEDGSFTINAKQGDALVFSAVSFETTEKKIGSASTYDLVLTNTSTILSDVVVVGYGRSSRKNLSSAVTTIKPEDLNRGAIGDVNQLLQGKVPGLNITASGDPNRSAAILTVLLFLSHYFLSQAQVYVRDSAGVPKSADSLIKKVKALNFIAMGDWGRNGAGYQKKVAEQMGKTATEINAQFIIATGDNFYPSGVISEWDPLWKYSFEDIYTAFSLQWDWYPVLGNHDYKSNPDAQVKYSTISRRWKMPARYYSKKFFINGDTSQAVLIIFIDTNPFIPQFYKNAEYGPNVRTQDSTQQKKWLTKLLSDQSPGIKWKIVVGHHPMYTGGQQNRGL